MRSLKASNSSVLVTSVPIKIREGAPLWDRLIDFMWPREEALCAATKQQRSRDWAQARLEEKRWSPAEDKSTFPPDISPFFSWMFHKISLLLYCFFKYYFQITSKSAREVFFRDDLFWGGFRWRRTGKMFVIYVCLCVCVRACVRVHVSEGETVKIEAGC